MFMPIGGAPTETFSTPFRATRVVASRGGIITFYLFLSFTSFSKSFFIVLLPLIQFNVNFHAYLYTLTIWILYFHVTDWSVWFFDLLLVTACGLRDTDVIWWKMACELGILDCRDPIMGSLKSPCTTSYRSSIESIALNCLLFETIAYVRILVTERFQDGESPPSLILGVQ